ncbi:MAG: SIS domain-containing protein [Acidobacteria bacterium]|nr:SIS domain-containing protein [Acidobacteriota bacterium]
MAGVVNLQPMRPNLRNEIFDLPQVLRESLEKGRMDYDNVLRRTPWGETPITFVGSATTLSLVEFMAGAFECLLEWPCAVRPASELGVDTHAKIGPKSIYFLVAGANESSDFLNVVQAVRFRNGFVLALGAKRDDPLVKAANGAFVVRPGVALGDISLPICEQAVAGYLALLTARALKRPRARFGALEREFGQLPGHLERAFAQHDEGVKALAAKLARAKNLTIIGGGIYHFSAVRAAGLLSQLAGIAARVRRVEEETVTRKPPFEGDSSILVVTGSRCRMKRQTLALVKTARRAGATVISLTDGNDREISRQSEMSLLLPSLDEITGATLVHAIIAWTAYEASRQRLVARNFAK